MKLLFSLFFIGIFFGIPTWLVTSSIQSQPLVVNERVVSKEDVERAKLNVKRINYQLNKPSPELFLTLSQADLDSILMVAGHTIPNTDFQGAISKLGVSIASSTEATFLGMTHYINSQCIVLPNGEKAEFESCQIGDIPISGNMVTQILDFSLTKLFDENMKKTVLGILHDMQINDGYIAIRTTKSADFNDDIKSSFGEVTNLVKSVNQTTVIEASHVEPYLLHINNLRPADRSLANYVKSVFEFAATRSQSNDPKLENTAAIWSLGIALGNHRFKDLLLNGNKLVVPKIPKTTLQNRSDLALHFLYSAILEELGRTDVAEGIGEIKELLDTGKGGSGFSFVDLAADKAGVAFSKFVKSSEESAFRAQEVLSNGVDERTFFPPTNGLVEGLTDAEFTSIYQDVESAKYHEVASEIDNRIALLALYR